MLAEGRLAWLIGAAPVAACAPIQDERPGALRLARGKQGSHQPAFGDAKYRRGRRVGRVEHRPNVVHALIDSERDGVTIGGAGAGLVVEDESTERGQTPEEVSGLRVLPEEIDVGDPAGDDQ